ncbi:hypothetical protein DLH72_01995 [Candidatus Gracilibacteria bacterium]|nr:MAG: hypothetical protein DLH72_01995 [Candidatus Gracilibacteria bacterium]
MKNKKENKFLNFLIYFIFTIFCINIFAFNPENKYDKSYNLNLNGDYEVKEFRIKNSSKILGLEVFGIYTNILYTQKDGKILKVESGYSGISKNLIPFMNYERNGFPNFYIFDDGKKFFYEQYFTSGGVKKNFVLEIIGDVNGKIESKIKEV